MSAAMEGTLERGSLFFILSSPFDISVGMRNWQ